MSEILVSMALSRRDRERPTDSKSVGLAFLEFQVGNEFAGPIFLLWARAAHMDPVKILLCIQLEQCHVRLQQGIPDINIPDTVILRQFH
jgi:hypothetical protein